MADPATVEPMAVEEEEEEETPADTALETATLEEMPSDLYGKIELIPQLLLEDMQMKTSKDVANALKALKGSLSDSNTNNEEYAAEACMLGAPSIVVLIMKKWAHKVSIQRYGCDCIKMLLCHERNAIIKAKGMQLVVTTMERFPESSELQQRASAALFNFFANISSRPEEERKKLTIFITELGGLTVLVKAMEAYPENTKLQQYCVGIVANFSPLKEFHQAMKESGALSAVAKAHENHPDDPSIKKRARRTMKTVLGS